MPIVHQSHLLSLFHTHLHPHKDPVIPIAHSRQQRYFIRRAAIISELNSLAADSQQPRKGVLTMQKLNQLLSISLLACLKSMPIQYPAKKALYTIWCEQNSRHPWLSVCQIYFADFHICCLLKLIDNATVTGENKWSELGVLMNNFTCC